MKEPEFDGDDYQTERDKPRLTDQLQNIKLHMENKGFVRVSDIARKFGYPEPSVSAQIRNLRKERFGSRTVTRRYRGNGIYEFKLEPLKKDPQFEMDL